MQCKNNGNDIPEESTNSHCCGNKIQKSLGFEDKKLSFKWHKLQIYFILFAKALAALLLGFSLVSESIYGFETGEMYLQFPALKIVNVLAGVIVLTYGILCIITRSRLAHFKKNSVFFLFATYISIIVISFIYQLAVNLATGIAVWTWPELSNIFITQMALLNLNVRYYKKRIEFFIN